MSTTVDEALVAQLLGNTRLMALVGGRLYPMVVPQDAEFPAIAYQLISSPPAYSHSGSSAFTRSRFQLTVEADSVAAAKAVAQAVRVCVGGQRWTTGTLTVYGAFIENDSDGYSDQRTVPVVRIDVVIQHNGD